MFDNAIHGKKLRFRTMLMYSWYATKELMKHIHASGKLFYCPLKSNRARQTGQSAWIPGRLQAQAVSGRN
jgi:hypothetical protein